MSNSTNAQEDGEAGQSREAASGTPEAGPTVPPAPRRPASTSTNNVGSLLPRASNTTGSPSPMQASLYSYAISPSGSSANGHIRGHSLAHSQRRGTDSPARQTTSLPQPTASSSLPSSASTAQLASSQTQSHPTMAVFNGTTASVPPLFGSYSAGRMITNEEGPARQQQPVGPMAPTTSAATPHLGYWRPLRQRTGPVPPWITSVPGMHNTTASADLNGWTSNRSGSRSTAQCQENNLLAFSWVIKNARLLRDEVEEAPRLEEGRSVSAGPGSSEVWACQPIFGDAKWKLELVRSERLLSSTGNDPLAASLSESAPSHVPCLAAYLTSLVVEGAPQDLSIPTSIMFGIRAPCLRPSAPKEWLWTHNVQYTFRPDVEFYGCHDLPTMSTLLENSEVADMDAFELVVQLGTGQQVAHLGANGSANHRLPFEIPHKQFVPTSIIAGLSDMVDNPGTADVALIVRERGIVITASTPPDLVTVHCRRERDTVGLQVEPWPLGLPLPRQRAVEDEAVVPSDEAAPELVVRDRVIWAHASILRSRSDYFRTMLDSGFSEGQGVQSSSQQASYGGRRIHVLRLPHADFATAQALVRFFYTAQVDLMESEDVRSVIFDDEWASVGLSEGAESYQCHAVPVWEWRSLEEVVQHQLDATLASSLSSTHTRVQNRSSQGSMRPPSSLSKGTGKSPRSCGDGEERPEDHPNTRQPSGSSNATMSTRRGDDGDSRPGKGAAAAAPLSSGDAVLAALLHTDPHSHPAPSPSRASSLSLYTVAHRLHLTTLADLAKGHFVATLSPGTAFAALLATSLYPALHDSVRAFVLEQWAAVSVSADFERCCDEVGSGVWGSEAGKAMRHFMRALAASNPAASAQQ
ncbi:unnamed protein product [Parajaminaea phylloscopi]